MDKSLANRACEIYLRAIEDYLLSGRKPSQEVTNPYSPETVEGMLYEKNWIDNQQWSLEDIIRDPDIEPTYALEIKRWIDRSNQRRTDKVEDIDSYLRDLYRDVTPLEGAKLNTESPAWALDRLSILLIKIQYMQEASTREDATQEAREKSLSKLAVLLEQRKDLTKAIDELLEDIAEGRKFMKVYRQMKMYNDPELNPMLKGKEIL